MTNAKRERQRWKQEAAQILLPGPEWHPLDGVPAPEYIPPAWDGPHVGLRLIEAFKVLNNLPLGVRRGWLSGYWPEYWHDWGDLLAQEQGPDDNKDVPRLRVRPSTNEITRMEQVIVWPGRYIADDDMRFIVQRVGFLRSHDVDLQHIARRLRRVPREVRNLNRSGLDQIAGALRRDATVVF